MNPVDFAIESTESINNIAAHEFGHLIGSNHLYNMHSESFEHWAGRPPVVGEERGSPGRYARRDDVMGTGVQAQLESLGPVEQALSNTLGPGQVKQYVPPPPAEEMECSPYFLP